MSDSQVRDIDGAVLTCTVSDCGYNRSLKCFAPSIAVGDDHPYCDTYTRDRVPPAENEGFVSQCLTMKCDFNDAGHCSARHAGLPQRARGLRHVPRVIRGWRPASGDRVALVVEQHEV